LINRKAAACQPPTEPRRHRAGGRGEGWPSSCAMAAPNAQAGVSRSRAGLEPATLRSTACRRSRRPAVQDARGGTARRRPLPHGRSRFGSDMGFTAPGRRAGRDTTRSARTGQRRGNKRRRNQPKRKPESAADKWQSCRETPSSPRSAETAENILDQVVKVRIIAPQPRKSARNGAFAVSEWREWTPGRSVPSSARYARA
jgi:hypothetical protein